ncbi:hypothetical protein KAU32_12925 [bacterium]|nr:hypothetical protein [bacterium]
MNEIYSVLESWESGAKMTIKMAQEINMNIDQFMKKELEEINKIIGEIPNLTSESILISNEPMLIDKTQSFAFGHRKIDKRRMMQMSSNSAFGLITRLVSFTNAGMARLPSIISKLENWVNYLRATTNSLAMKMGANGFSISIGLPVGISIGLSFPIYGNSETVVGKVEKMV